MRFSNLFKKEFRELMNKQVILSMILSVGMFAVIGIAFGTMDLGGSSEGYNSYNICVQDDSEFTKNMLENITADGNTALNYYTIESDDYATELAKHDLKTLVIIPDGYGEKISQNGEKSDLIFVSEGKIGSFLSAIDSMGSNLIDEVKSATRRELYTGNYGLTDEQLALATSPTTNIEFTNFNGKTARVPAESLTMLSAIQMLPVFAIFFLLLMASQMIMTAISTEKIDKTLETLLSTPVTRLNVLIAKMSAALLAAFLNALAMAVGFGIYMIGIASGTASAVSSSVGNSISASETAGMVAESLNMADALNELGIGIGVLDFVVIFVQLFLALAIGLALSLILGAMATDIKSVQTLTFPIMLPILISFFIAMFADISSMSPVFQVVVYLIPFVVVFQL